jgi:hypothetical protein
MGFFKGKKAIIATKHKKEEVISPILENQLGLLCVTHKGLDTDLLGTFSGEVERLDDPISTLRKKCQMAIEVSGINVAIASEGSFGAHPSIFFASADDEFVMLMDRENGIEVIEKELSLETNFDGTDIKSVDELIEFASKIGFPSHGIILKKAKRNFKGIIKESQSINKLIENYQIIKNADGSAYAETDMRAMHNPTRMKVIAKATEKLVCKINSLCPSCNIPGFGVVGEKKGLPCQICGLPTRSMLKHIYCCYRCNFQMDKVFPFEKQVEDPQYCDFCNP